MANLTDLIPLVRERVHNCPDPVIEQALRWAARDFSRETHIWTVNANFTLNAGASSLSYSFTSPGDTDIVAWRMLLLDDGAIPITILDRPEWPRVRSDSTPKYAYFEDVNTVTFDAEPAENISIRYEIAIMNARDSNIVDDTYMSSWGDALAAGARYKLLTQPDRYWSDLNAAQMDMSEYRQAIMNAKQHIHKGFGTTPKRVLQNRFI
jgi:hypothetical protein